MNTLPPNEPLDEQEREFARILHALPGGDPPPALDAAILRAAANAAAASSNRPVRRVLASAGALWGIGTAAAAVLALGVAWRLRYGVTDQQAAETAAPRAHVVADTAEDDSVQVELDTQPADAPFVPPPPPPPSEALAAKPVAPTRFRQQPAQPARVAPAAAAPAAAPEAFAEDHLDEHVAREAAAAELELKGFAAQKERQAMAKAAASNAAPPPPPTPMAAPMPAPTSAADSSLDKVSVVGGARDDAATGAAAGALARAEPAKTGAPLRKPGTWLADIRKLRDAGKIGEARASLVEFRKKYPKWVVPTDLAPLLSE
jgi:type IV secretory pathway VirB10-like protein